MIAAAAHHVTSSGGGAILGIVICLGILGFLNSRKGG